MCWRLGSFFGLFLKRFERDLEAPSVFFLNFEEPLYFLFGKIPSNVKNVGGPGVFF